MDWINYLPQGLPQYLKQETFTCSCHAPIDAIESQILYLTGERVQFSRRWLCYMSHTSPTQGNSEQVVLPTIAKFGLVLESSWPQRADMTEAEFYTPPTPEEAKVLAYEGAAWLEKWEVIPDYYKQLSDLNKAPLIVRVNTGSTFHFMEVLNPTTYYDSEYNGGQIGPIPASQYPVVVEYHQIIIKNKMPTKYKIHNKDGRLGVMLDFGFEAVIHYAKDMTMYNHLLTDYEVPADAVTKEL